MNAYAELPLGFGIALAENPQAGRAFEALSAQQQQEVLSKTHAVSSKQEMQAFVQSLADGKQTGLY